MTNANIDIKEEENKLAEAISGVVIDPIRAARCRVEGCNGRKGYILMFLPGTGWQIKLCCGTVGKTEYARMIETMELLIKNLSVGFVRIKSESRTLKSSMRNHFLALDEHLIDLHRSTPFGFIAWKLDEARQAVRRGWYRLRKRISK